MEIKESYLLKSSQWFMTEKLYAFFFPPSIRLSIEMFNIHLNTYVLFRQSMHVNYKFIVKSSLSIESSQFKLQH